MLEICTTCLCYYENMYLLIMERILLNSRALNKKQNKKINCVGKIVCYRTLKTDVLHTHFSLLNVQVNFILAKTNPKIGILSCNWLSTGRAREQVVSSQSNELISFLVIASSFSDHGSCSIVVALTCKSRIRFTVLQKPGHFLSFPIVTGNPICLR